MAQTQLKGAQVLDSTITDADVASANKDGAAGTASMRTLGTGASQATAGNDSRLSDSRTPTTHDNTLHTTTGTPGSSAIADAAAQGSSASVARLDHTHGREDLAQSNSQPAANETILANYSAYLIGLPYIIPSNIVITINSGGILVLES